MCARAGARAGRPRAMKNLSGRGTRTTIGGCWGSNRPRSPCTVMARTVTAPSPCLLLGSTEAAAQDWLRMPLVPSSCALPGCLCDKPCLSACPSACPSLPIEGHGVPSNILRTNASGVKLHPDCLSGKGEEHGTVDETQGMQGERFEETGHNLPSRHTYPRPRPSAYPGVSLPRPPVCRIGSRAREPCR